MSAASDKWQPIETAPKDGTKVLIFVMGKNVMQASYSRCNEYWIDCWCSNMSGVYSPTHWQPLPKPPKEDEG